MSFIRTSSQRVKKFSETEDSYSVRDSLIFAPILIQMNRVHALLSSDFEITFNIILSSTYNSLNKNDYHFLVQQ